MQFPWKGGWPPVKQANDPDARHLVLPPTPVLVEVKFVGLERVFASQALGEEVRREIQDGSGGRIKTIGARVAIYSKAQGGQAGIEPDVRRQWSGPRIVRSNGDERTSPKKSRAQEEVPPGASQEFSEDQLTGLFKGQSCLRIPGAESVQIVVQIPSSVDRRGAIGVPLKVQLST